MADGLTSVPGGYQPDQELQALEEELGRLARELQGEDINLEAPPIDLWAAIEAETEAMVPTESIEGQRPVPARPSPLRPRTGLHGFPAALAAAAVLAMVVATGAALIVRSSNAETTVAQAAIANDGLPVPIAGFGNAVLKQRGDDQFLELELPDLDSADPDSVYEVWMIDSDVAGMISLGNLAATGGGTTRIHLPESIDHQAFPVIDISVEPLDGDPTHSGQSVLRGVLADVDGA